MITRQRGRYAGDESPRMPRHEPDAAIQRHHGGGTDRTGAEVLDSLGDLTDAGDMTTVEFSTVETGGPIGLACDSATVSFDTVEISLATGAATGSGRSGVQFWTPACMSPATVPRLVPTTGAMARVDMPSAPGR